MGGRDRMLDVERLGLLVEFSRRGTIAAVAALIDGLHESAVRLTAAEKS